ncbi:MAG: proline--tRNA ligase anticodon binding domain-containing protein, partial [Flavobacteriaceae bacterium]
TRLMGALIMTHSDDNGLVLPPNLAPIQLAIVPIYKTDEQRAAIAEVAEKLKAELEAMGYTVKFDKRDNFKPGYKFNEYEIKGVPLRIAIGPRDLENKQVEIARRDTLEKKTVALDAVTTLVPELLIEMQEQLFDRAKAYRTEHTTEVDDFETFKTVLNDKGGFIAAHWDGTPETEEAIKKATKATIRCLPIDVEKTVGKCVFSGKPSSQRVLFAKAY